MSQVELTFPGKAAAKEHATADEPSELGFDFRESRHARTARHAFVEGDNLPVLRLLEPAYRGRVHCIYIDPPYNRNRDFVYRDRWSDASPGADAQGHGTWLRMMYPRLCLARQLLEPNGLLFVSIDDREVHHLRVVLDEIFGQDCFIAQIVVVNNRGGRDYMRVAIGHEYVLCYGGSPRTPVREAERPQVGDPLSDGRGVYELRELRNRNPRFGPHNRPNLFYPVFVNPQVRDPHDGLAVSLEPQPGYDVCVEPRNRRGAGSVWRWGQDRVLAGLVPGDPSSSEVVAKRRRDGGYNVYEKCRKATTRPRALWDESEFRSECGTIETRAIWGDALFDHPKPVALIRRCLQMTTDPAGIVMDFFAGSGTTGQAVLEQNAADGGMRRFVLVQRPEPTPADSAANRAGYRDLAALARSRLHRLLPKFPGEGLRAFELVEAAPDRTDPRRPLLWTRAVSRGVMLDASCDALVQFKPTGSSSA